MISYKFKNGTVIELNDFEYTETCDIFNVDIKNDGLSETLLVYCEKDTYLKIINETVGRIFFVKLYSASTTFSHLIKDMLIPVYSQNGKYTVLDYEV